MGLRPGSQSPDCTIKSYIDTSYDNVKTVSDNIDDVNKLASEIDTIKYGAISFVQEEVPSVEGITKGARWYKPSEPTMYIYYINEGETTGSWVEDNSVGDDISYDTINDGFGSTLREDLTALNSQDTSLSNRVDSSEGRLDIVEGQLSDTSNGLTALRGNVNTNTSDIGDLRTDLTTEAGKVTTLQQEDIDNKEVLKSILLAQGLSGDYGFFADGFTYVNEGDVCISTDNKIWLYVGAGAPNKVVTAGTVPSAGSGYEQVTFNAASGVLDVRGTNLQDYIDSNLPPFKTVADMKATAYLSTLPEFTRVEWQGYHTQSDGGSNWGILRFGAHAEDGGSIFSINTNTYVESNLKGKTISVRKFGAVGDNTVDDLMSIQTCLDYLEGSGGCVRLPAGSFRTTGRLVINRSGNTTDPSEGGMVGVDLVGYGAATSRIFADHDDVCLEYKGGLGAGWHSFLQIKGIGLTKKNFNKAVGSVGLLMSDAAYFKISDFDTTHFEYGIKGEDVLSGSISNSTIRFNEHGFRFEKIDRTHPNNISFRGVSIINNRTTGGSIIKPHVFSFFGGSIESNGYTGVVADPNSWGLYVENSGAEGSIGLNMNGSYLENNNGRADVWIQQSSGSVVHNFSGCSFLRFLNTRYVKNNIELSSPTSNKTIVSLHGCGFKDIAPYVSDNSRLFLGGGDAKFYNGGGNKFEGTGVTPPLSSSNFAPLGEAQQLPYTALPDAAEFRNATTYCPDMLGSGQPAIAVSDGSEWRQIPLGIYSGSVNQDGTSRRLPKGWSSRKDDTGIYTLTHNLSAPSDSYCVVATPLGVPNTGSCTGQAVSGDSVELYFSDTVGTAADMGFSFILSRM